jgi:hypothetical protein
MANLWLLTASFLLFSIFNYSVYISASCWEIAIFYSLAKILSLVAVSYLIFSYSVLLMRSSCWIVFSISPLIFSASYLLFSLNSVYKLVKRLCEEILTSTTSQVSNQIPHPVISFYISSLTPSLSFDLFLRISLIVKLAILSLIIETSMFSSFWLAILGPDLLSKS